MRDAAGYGRADRRPSVSAARLRGRGRPSRGHRGSPAAGKRPPTSSKQGFRSLLTPVLSRTGREVSYLAWPGGASSGPRVAFFHPPDVPCVLAVSSPSTRRLSEET